MNHHALLQSPICFKNKRLLVVAPHSDDDIIGCGALLFYLANCDARQKPASIHIAYAVSGFNGVSDSYLKDVRFFSKSLEEKNGIKRAIREKEAKSCCESLGAEPIFWNLPFYEKQEKNFSKIDLDIVCASLINLNPDIIFLIDEVSDPHGTHGFVQQICLQAFEILSFSRELLGYRVWHEGYTVDESDVMLLFNDAVMREQEKLLMFYESQLKDPAYPHEKLSFLEIMRLSNKKAANRLNSDWPFAQCYKLL